MESNYWTRKRISRRGILRGTALGAAGLAGAVLIGCGDDEGDSSSGGGSSSGGDATQGGTLTAALSADVNTLDPALSVSTTDNSITMAVYDNLIRRRADGSLEPMLAESWEANADLSEYTLKLREGVKFRNIDRVLHLGRREVLDRTDAEPGHRFGGQRGTGVHRIDRDARRPHGEAGAGVSERVRAGHPLALPGSDAPFHGGRVTAGA